MSLRALSRRWILLLLCIGLLAAGLAWGGWLWCRPSTQVTAPPQPEPPHPPMTTLRERVMLEFHGNASNLFVNEDGFGSLRLGPLLKK